MLIPAIEIEFHLGEVTEVTVEVFQSYTEPRIPCPTTEELGRCPPRFRCFSCQRIRGRSHLGGEMREQRICRECYPYLDDADVRAMINFDLKHGFQVPGRPRPKFRFPKGSQHTEPYRKTREEMKELVWVDKGGGYLVQALPRNLRKRE